MCELRGGTSALQQGVILHKKGDLHGAEEKYRQAAAELENEPSAAEVLHNLGALMVQRHGTDKVKEAIPYIKRAIQLQPSSWRFRNMLGIMYEKCDQHHDAADAFERAHEKAPRNIKVLLNLARVLKECGRSAAAAEAYGKVVSLDPDHLSAHYKRATVLRHLGRREQAVASLREHMRLHPDDAHTKFWIAAMTGNSAEAAACPEVMVAGLFDDYADHFDEHLIKKLQYRTPQLLLDLLLQTSNSSSCASHRWQRCIDLGCGTGLMGPLLKPHVAGCLEGVDLSAGMVDKARERGLYDELHVAELVTYLQRGRAAGSTKQQGQPAGSSRGSSRAEAQDGEAVVSSTTTSRLCRYDLLVAADVFVYIGNLQPVLQAAADIAKPGAMMCFSTEQMQEACLSSSASRSTSSSMSEAVGSNGTAAALSLGYEVQLTGRYVHSQRYLQEVAEQTGWEVLALSTAAIRMNMGKPVLGSLCVLRLKQLSLCSTESGAGLQT